MDKIIKEVRAQIIEKQFKNDSGEIIYYYQLFIPELEKNVPMKLVGLEKKALGIK